MADADLSLHAVRTVDQLLARLPQGRDIIALLRNLSLWVGEANPLNPDTRKVFPADVSNLTSGQLGDHNAYWSSELSRVIMLIGVIESQRLELVHRAGKARSQAASRVLREVTVADKAPTAGQLKLLCDAETSVCDCDDKVLFVDMLLTALGAVKLGYENYCRVLSREITRTGDLLRSRL